MKKTLVSTAQFEDEDNLIFQDNPAWLRLYLNISRPLRIKISLQDQSRSSICISKKLLSYFTNYADSAHPDV